MERTNNEVDSKEKDILEEIGDFRNKNKTNDKIIGKVKNVLDRTLETQKV